MTEEGHGRRSRSAGRTLGWGHHRRRRPAATAQASAATAAPRRPAPADLMNRRRFTWRGSPLRSPVVGPPSRAPGHRRMLDLEMSGMAPRVSSTSRCRRRCVALAMLRVPRATHWPPPGGLERLAEGRQLARPPRAASASAVREPRSTPRTTSSPWRSARPGRANLRSQVVVAAQCVTLGVLKDLVRPGGEKVGRQRPLGHTILACSTDWPALSVRLDRRPGCPDHSRYSICEARELGLLSPGQPGGRPLIASSSRSTPRRCRRSR